MDSLTDRIGQRVTRHSGGNAAMAMDQVRELVTGCVPNRTGDSLSILAERLSAGYERLLVPGGGGGGAPALRHRCRTQ